MRNYPTEEYESKELEELNAEQWMVDALKMNPGYVGWGPYEYYMCDDKGGWASRVILESWEDNGFGLDELNEVVNFYFEVTRASKECESCAGGGYNPETKKIADAWYDFEGTGSRWCDKITQDEVQALLDSNRLSDLTRGRENYTPTADEVNAWNGKGFGHDEINRFICIEQRAKRLGVWGHCEHCHGNGYVFTEPKAKLGLILWVLHPRKGCSRGVHFKEIKKEEIPKVVDYLKSAKKRNNDRFSALVA